jgi:hypothetical protein
MTATGVTGRGPALPGRLARSLRGAGLSGAALAGAGAAGALVSVRAAVLRVYWLIAALNLAAGPAGFVRGP